MGPYVKELYTNLVALTELVVELLILPLILLWLILFVAGLNIDEQRQNTSMKASATMDVLLLLLCCAVDTASVAAGTVLLLLLYCCSAAAAPTAVLMLHCCWFCCCCCSLCCCFYCGCWWCGCSAAAVLLLLLCWRGSYKDREDQREGIEVLWRGRGKWDLQVNKGSEGRCERKKKTYIRSGKGK